MPVTEQEVKHLAETARKIRKAIIDVTGLIINAPKRGLIHQGENPVPLHRFASWVAFFQLGFGKGVGELHAPGQRRVEVKPLFDILGHLGDGLVNLFSEGVFL